MESNAFGGGNRDILKHINITLQWVWRPLNAQRWINPWGLTKCIPGPDGKQERRLLGLGSEV